MSNQVLTIIKPGYTTTISKTDFLGTIPASLRFTSSELKVILDSNQDLVVNRESAFVVRVSGDGMAGSGIHDGDKLIVDRTLQVQNTNVVVVVIEGEFTIRRVKKENGRVWLMPENDKYHPIEIDRKSEVEIWGVVTNIIHPVL